ncbi:MAG TPA: hypothetical protein VKZ53_24465 [Candidatus Angelobacter sp.]|nr:hypothetical protein [Candidatus Angelobacter sp.]
MKTMTENQVQIAGATLPVEVSNANSIATPVALVACPDTAVLASAPVYVSQLRGYSR